MDSHLRSRDSPSPAPEKSYGPPCKRFSPAAVFSLSPTLTSMTPQHLPSAALVTDQCTDQCVVITCDDPDHVDGISCDSLYSEFLAADGNAFLNYTTSCSRGPDDPCSSKCSTQPVLQQGTGCGADCDAVYMDPSKCAECTPTLLDDFCCSDSYQPSRQPSISPELNVAMSGNTEYYWHQTPLGSSSLSSQIPIEQRPPPIVYNLNCLPPRPSQSNHNENVPSDPMTTCHWGQCDASFSSPNELIEHVNLHHLSSWETPARARNETSASQTALTTISGSHKGDSPTDVSKLSCHWRNCDKHPAEHEPKPHTCPLPYEQWRDLIAVHIFRDHLGLPPDIASGASEIPQDCSEAADASHSSSMGTEARNIELDVLSTPTLSPTLSNLTALESVDVESTPPQEYADKGLPHTLEMDIDPPQTAMPSACVPSKTSHKCLWLGCSESFETCEDLTAHLSKVHVGGGRPVYECFWEGCTRNKDAGFGSRQKINRHLQSHTGHRPFQCSVCQQNFSEAATLQQHMRRHTQEKPYVCDHPGCGKSFAIAGALTIHKRIHSGHKPFKCTHCDRAFAESSNLSKHLRTHTGVKPYTCTEPGCVKTFARPDQLTRHLATHRRKTRERVGK